MQKIETCVLNPESVRESEKMMVCAARLTQKGHAIKNLDDFMALYNKSCTDKTKNGMVKLPHTTLQKYGTINVVVIGASRRFLAQITRHQNEVKYMSASLQYSDYSADADFVVPYEMIDKPEMSKLYLDECTRAMNAYADIVAGGCSNDSAGYAAPQGLRNILIISATPYQWKHMISQRVCRRNTTETRYVMLRIWEHLYSLSEILFEPSVTGPFCVKDACKEGHLCCGQAISGDLTPTQILETDFSLLMKRDS